MQQVVYSGRHLRYLTVYPEGYRAEETYPLVIGLHGFGAAMDDLAGLAERLVPNVLFVFPEAPKPAFDGADPGSRAWYERGDMATPRSIAEAETVLDSCVQEVLERYPRGKHTTVLFGFSQGAAMALRYGLPRPTVFAGVGMLSGALRHVEELHDRLPSGRKQAMFLVHGVNDQLVPPVLTQRAVTLLRAWGYQPTYHTYPSGHWITPEVLADLDVWLRSVLR